MKKKFRKPPKKLYIVAGFDKGSWIAAESLPRILRSTHKNEPVYQVLARKIGVGDGRSNLIPIKRRKK